MLKRILVWDVPTRVFHWLLVLSFAGAYVTAESERYRDIHVVLGYTLLGLLAFRLLWGIFGTRYARFRSFLFKPAEVAAYFFSLLKGKPAHYVGHNPLGSVAIWLLLGLGITAGVTGVLLFQDIGGDAMEELHEIASNAMLLVVLLHIAGVVTSSLLHRENLARSMITGYKTAQPEQAITRPYLWLGAIILAAVVAFWVAYPATGLLTPAADSAHAAQKDDD
ncbi:MAG: cytochrome B [Gallionellales bacterium 35-53-114]|jgi:cytochrome b|nr:MAG: cytochrome B [Gallionellales bacterium 35-53-114]OYZ62555.1 MAG: cytochrome B [Gallionellales bacterium 24-53-125]OZB09514.1 MAG: cytochrome B [Gallionellales bacterium 39-52-133]HQS57819.1 cytochrome b/b6 domain-containing protein [Gallionellaceae bacterium]HQS74272.1 cytochrome b/b6 domain-containing protein [Gallionellaceae bacterium]